jgi:UDP-N-acetyl-D-glucosamine dehydrogenase
VRGEHVAYAVVHRRSLHIDGIQLSADDISSVAAADCAVIVTDHSSFNYPKIVEQAKLIVDTRNALKGIASDKIVRL